MWVYMNLLAYVHVLVTVRYILDETKYLPETTVVCGCGLARLENHMENRDVSGCSDIQRFPTVNEHKSILLFVSLIVVSLMLMHGYFHY